MYCPVGKNVPFGLPLATVAIIGIDENVIAPMKAARKRPVLILPDISVRRKGIQLATLDQNIDCSERRVKPREHLSRTQVRLPADRGSAVNLLGLGANATLVLIDGRRQVTYPFAQFGTEGFVDLNSIPIAAVDRIEYLKDGASAIYGSDAIAGVVNIILKDEYEGADLKFYFGSTSRGDYQVYHLSAVTGLSEKLGENSKFSLLATFDYYDQSPVLSEDRTYSSELQHSKFGSYYDQAQTNSTAGYFGDAAGNTYTAIPGTRGPQITQNDFIINGPSNSLLTVKDTELIPREQRYGSYFKVNYEPTDRLKLYEQFMYQRNEEINQNYASQPTQADPITIPANNPYNPFGLPLQPLGQTLSEVGAQTQDAVIQTYRTVSGATLFLPKNWSIDFSFLYAESDGDANSYNEVSVSKLNAALAGTLPGYVGQFYNPFVDQAAVSNPNGGIANGIRITQFQDVRSSLLIWALRAGGEVIDLPGGPITIGLGLEYQSDDYVSRVDHYTATFDVVGLGAAINGVGKRYEKSAYYQVLVPILGEKWSWPGARALQAIVSERDDNYSDFGLAAKPKFALLYKPFNDLTFRATYSEGYRAPALTELYSGTSFAFEDLVDPKNPSLGEQSYEVRTSGNPNLKAETSYGYYVGAVWSPGSADPEHSWWGWANGFNAYIDWFQVQKGNDISVLNAQQLLNQENDFPGLDNYKGTLPDAAVEPNGAVHRIGSFTTLDWQISYELGAPAEISPQTPRPGYGKDGKKLVGEAAISPKPEASNRGIKQWLAGSKVTFGINNVFDTSPPFADTFVGYDPQTANPLGRYFYFELEKKF